MRTYTELFGVPQFTALFVASSAQVAASTVTGLALATLVYSATGSPLLSALVMFGPSLAQVAGASLLLSAADQIPPRATLTWLALIFALGTFAQALPGVGVGAILAIGFALGVVSSLGGGVRYGLMNEIVPPAATCSAGRSEHVGRHHADHRLRRSAASWSPSSRHAKRC